MTKPIVHVAVKGQYRHDQQGMESDSFRLHVTTQWLENNTPHDEVITVDAA